MTVEELLSRISSHELTEWMAFASLEPFGEERADYRMAIMLAKLLEPHRDTKKHRKPFTPEEFLPKFERAKQSKGQTWQQQLGLAQMWNTLFGGKDIRGKKA